MKKNLEKTQNTVEKFKEQEIIEKYLEEQECFFQKGDVVYSTTYGVCTITEFKARYFDKTKELHSVDIVYIDKGGVSHFSDLYSFQNTFKIETSIEDFQKDVEDLCSGQVTIQELLSIREIDSEKNNNNSLMILDKNILIQRKNDLIKKENFIRSRYKAMEIVLEKRKRELYHIAEEARKYIKKVQKLILTVELYLGVQETLEQIQIGLNAPKESPVCLRQRKLYMDIECGDPSDQGIDFRTTEKFNTWLLQTNTYWKKKNYEILIPEEKCVVVFENRKSDKHYHDNPFINHMMNAENHRTCIIIRNGENIYVIWSELIRINNTLFPNQNELEELLKSIESDREYDKEKAENTLFSYKNHIILLQGIIERTPCFSDNNTLSLFNPEDLNSGMIKFIYDADLKRQLPANIPSFKSWRLNLNQSISEGSRIFLTKITNKGYINPREENKYRMFKEYHYNEFAYPTLLPGSGIYEVFESEIKENYRDCNTLYIKADIADKGWRNEDKKTKRKSWSIRPKEDEFIINYDAITEKELDTLEFYMYTRIGREDYLSYIPLLMELYKQRKTELNLEKEFVKLILSNLKLESNDENNQLILSTIDWWKLKNKWKRGLDKDNTKALRMIERKIKKDIYG